MAPIVKGRGLERRYGAPALVGVNVVRPVGRRSSNSLDFGAVVPGGKPSLVAADGLTFGA